MARKNVNYLLGYDPSTTYCKESDVNGGEWVLIRRAIPVDKSIAPQVYGIYWATPAEDTYGRQKVKIYTPTEYTHHTENANTGRCYLPTPELREQIEAVFGKYGMI